MGRSLIFTGLLAVAGLFMLAAVETGGRNMAPGATAGEYQGHAKPRRHTRRGRAPREGAASPEEIARYFQLYGGNIDPAINKQSQAGPFDSGFFFDSGFAPNGGDSPYMN